MAHPNLMNKKNLIDVVKHRWGWLTCSILLLIPCIAAMIYSMTVYPNHAPIKLGIDFTGGTILQYAIDEEIQPSDIEKLRSNLRTKGVEDAIIQTISNAGVPGAGQKTETKIAHIVSIKTKFIEEGSNTEQTITQEVKSQFPSVEKPIQTNSIGPTLGKELLKNSLVAILLALLGITAYVTLRFQFDYAWVSLISLVHDVIFVVGAFSILSLLFNTQLDSLFITALLTVIGFSMHDKVVVFDRVRENSRFLAKKYSMNEIINASVNQTLARSINTALTTLIVLAALYFFGGATTKDFVLAMIIGIAIGTYSSIFFASLLLAWYREKKGTPGVEAV